MDRTAVRSRVGLTEAPPASRRRPPLDRGQVRFRTLLFRYLAVGFILLATVVVANPSVPDAAADRDPWDYQREQVDIQGRGVLNAYARSAVRATAWLAKSSIERQRDMLRLSLFDVLVGAGAADSIGGWRTRNADLLEAGTKAALLGPHRLGSGAPPGMAQPGRGGAAAAGRDRGRDQAVQHRRAGDATRRARAQRHAGRGQPGRARRRRPGPAGRRADPAAAAHPLLEVVRGPPAVAHADRHGRARRRPAGREGERARVAAQERLRGQRLGGRPRAAPSGPSSPPPRSATCCRSRSGSASWP